MSQTDLFAALGARLANQRWSWGSVRLSDNTVFLRVWRDRVEKRNEAFYVQVTHEEKFRNDPDDLGYKERLKHVELIKGGAACYLIMCEAVDVNAMPRQVKDFDRENVFPGGNIVQFDDDWWIELRPRVSVRQAMLRQSD